MESTGPLIPEQRHQRVLQLLRRDGVLSTRALTEHLGVSHMTVRRDIAALEESGQVVSVQGGVRLAGTAGQVPPQERRQRAVLELPRKRAIAAAAAELVTDGMVIYLDAGTTCESVVAYLAGRRDLTVVTNDFYAVTALFDVPDVEVIHTGGAVDKASASSSGRLAAATLSAINLDLFFLSTGAWSVSRGVSAPTLDKVELKRAAMASASTTVLLADSTKYGTASKFQVAPLVELDLVVSDTDLPGDTRKRVEDLGVELRLASAT
ncbi:DeoR/GlpR family DNA-binding transcription regulator [Kribbella sp. HUAS MG21]|uniref:DeoR/GlpR family DNA-binding transcription regulator n=1 Tax=Kribbella sp. HUAS MG21 TaxID=3160966 RepID=A0AAU7T6B8_9ACTN